MKHIITEEGSREHVVYWDTNGPHCSETDCDMNSKETEE